MKKTAKKKTAKKAASKKAPAAKKKAPAKTKTAAKKSAAKKSGNGAKKENRPRTIPPHPRYPDVEKLPYKWQPGTKDKPGSRGRPPTGWKKNKQGDYVAPKGWRNIAGNWHKPMEKSKRK